MNPNSGVHTGIVFHCDQRELGQVKRMATTCDKARRWLVDNVSMQLFNSDDERQSATRELILQLPPTASVLCHFFSRGGLKPMDESCSIIRLILALRRRLDEC